MYRFILLSIVGVALVVGDEFPARLPNVRQNYRNNEIIQYSDANHMGRTINALCEKIGINNTQLYGNRYTNTFDYKIYLLFSNAIANNASINYLMENGLGGSSASNVVSDVLYITRSPENSDRTVGLRLYYDMDSYTNNAQIGYQFYVFEETNAYVAGLTNTVLVSEFENEMRFYGYQKGGVETPSRNAQNMVMKLVAPTLEYSGSTNAYTSVGGGAYFGQGLVVDDRNFITNNNNFYRIDEREKFYMPVTTSNSQSFVSYVNPGEVSNWYGSFLVFKPKPQGLSRKIPVGYEFVDDEEFPVFTIRGKLNASGFITNVYQYWVADFHFTKVTGVPEPVDTEIYDAVPMGFLNKEFDRKIRQYQLNLMEFNPESAKTMGQYRQLSDRHYYNTLSHIFVNPVISTNPLVSVGGTNMVMHTMSTQNDNDGILLSYDDVATNSYIGGVSYPAQFTFSGIIVDPYNVLPNLYGIKARTEYTGLARIEPNENSTIVTVNPFENESGLTAFSTVIGPNTAILATPFKAPSSLYWYWVEYITTNQFRICLDAPQSQAVPFKWIIPHVLTATYNSVEYPKNRVLLGDSVIISNGQTESYPITINNLQYKMNNFTNEVALFTPLGYTTNIFGGTNLISWYQVRELTSTSSLVKVIVDAPVTRPIRFNWAIFKK
jgi:hypothetical protein